MRRSGFERRHVTSRRSNNYKLCVVMEEHKESPMPQSEKYYICLINVHCQCGDFMDVDKCSPRVTEPGGTFSEDMKLFS